MILNECCLAPPCIAEVLQNVSLPGMGARVQSTEPMALPQCQRKTNIFLLSLSNNRSKRHTSPPPPLEEHFFFLPVERRVSHLAIQYLAEPSLRT